MDYDELLHVLKKGGRYELLLVAGLCLPGLLNVFVFMSIVFLAGIPEHWCHVPDLTKFNLTQEQIRLVSIPLQGEADSEYSSCQMYDRNYSSWTEADVAAALDEDPATIGQRLSTVKCHHGWNYDRSQYESTVVSQWDLVCDYQWLKATAASVDYAGMMIGALLCGFLADKYGRKPVFSTAVILRSVVMVAIAFAPNYTAFVAMRFFAAAFSISITTTCFVALMEMVVPSWRVNCEMIFMQAWAVGYVILAGIGYLIRDWFTLQLTLAISTFIMLVVWLLPESPRWLYTHKRHEKADMIVRKIARINKVDLPEKLDITVKTTKKGSPLDILRSPRLRCRTINLFFNWAVNSMVYYGLSLNTSNLGGNDYINFLISGAVEIPAYFFCPVAMTHLGRVWSLSGTMIVGGVSLFAMLIVPSGMTWLTIALAMVGKFSITASFCIVFLVTVEVYPTTMRSIGLGSSSFCARIGGILAPYIAQLGATNKELPPVIFGAASIAAGLLALLLPETKGLPLPETLKDGEDLGKGQRLFSHCRSSNVEGNEGELNMNDSKRGAGEVDDHDPDVGQPMIPNSAVNV